MAIITVAVEGTIEVAVRAMFRRERHRMPVDTAPVDEEEVAVVVPAAIGICEAEVVPRMKTRALAHHRTGARNPPLPLLSRASKGSRRHTVVRSR